jgi:tetratricopeptide (TPR) repeat protein
MHPDRYGLALTTHSNVAAAAYREGVDLLLSAWPGVADAFDRAIAADPEFALAHIGRGRMNQIMGEAPQARARAASARELAARCSGREQGHINVLALAIEGNARAALTAGEEHLDEHPRDALVLSVFLGAFGLYAFSGRADHDAARVAICERHAAHYGEDWWFLTYRGWSHTEAGNVVHGRALTERALELRGANANAAHAYSHALFEQGKLASGQTFLDTWLPGYDRSGILNAHLGWHFALASLEADDVETALKIYDERLRPGASLAPPLNLLTDAASLLWRIGLAADPPALDERWSQVRQYAEHRFPKPTVAFGDVHCVLVEAATAASSTRVLELERMLAENRLPAGRSVLELARGSVAFAQGDFAHAASLIGPALSDLPRIGGSHAQRELFEDTYVVACLRAGQLDRAREFLDARLHRRPSARDEAWRLHTLH